MPNKKKSFPKPLTPEDRFLRVLGALGLNVYHDLLCSEKTLIPLEADVTALKLEAVCNLYRDDVEFRNVFYTFTHKTCKNYNTTFVKYSDKCKKYYNKLYNQSRSCCTAAGIKPYKWDEDSFGHEINSLGQRIIIYPFIGAGGDSATLNHATHTSIQIVSGCIVHQDPLDILIAAEEGNEIALGYLNWLHHGEGRNDDTEI
jgi:hypothetical protein